MPVRCRVSTCQRPMRVIVARSNLLYHPSVKKQRPCSCQKPRCRSRSVRHQSVVSGRRAFQGVFAFLTFSYGNGGTKSSKKCWNVTDPPILMVVRRALFQCRRSEEHTSELQSPYDLVCRLLLEKKNNTKDFIT